MFQPFWICFVFGLICLFRSIVFSLRNVLVLSVFGCFSFIINLCELLLPFSCELFQYWIVSKVSLSSHCEKCSYNSPLMFMWFSCTETYRWIACTSSSLDIYWCWHIFMCKMFQTFNIAFDYLLMLTIFHVQHILIILNWCLHHFLVLKHIDELHAFHLHWTFTDFDICFVWKIFQNFNIAFDYLLMLTIFHVQKCSYSFSIDVYVIFLYWNISINGTHFVFIGHLLMLINCY